jgi:hypothetical protein
VGLERFALVKTDKIGKPRPFWRGLLLTIVTFGLYGIYWRFKAPKEVHEQFELIKDGRDDHVVWLVLGLVLPVVMLVYEYKIVDNVRYIRRRLSLPEGISPGTFVGLRVASSAVTFLALLGVLIFAPTQSFESNIAQWLGAFGIAIVSSFALLGYAFWRLQTDINDVWQAWEARVDEFKDAPAETDPSEADPAPREDQDRFPGQAL